MPCGMLRFMTLVSEQSKRVAALMFGALLAGSPAAADDDYSATCRYLAAVAFKDMRTEAQATFRTELADDCHDALSVSRSGDVAARSRAVDYLAQLDAYRQVMIEMLLARAEAPGEAEIGGRGVLTSAIRPVSRAGGYLIARRLGVVRTHESWTEWRQSVALSVPPDRR